MALANQITLEKAFLMLGKEFPFLQTNYGLKLKGHTTMIVSGVLWYPDEILLLTCAREKDESLEEAMSGADGIDQSQFELETGLTIDTACQYIVQGLITEPSDSDTGIPAGVTVPLRSTACPMGIKNKVYKRGPL